MIIVFRDNMFASILENISCEDDAASASGGKHLRRAPAREAQNCDEATVPAPLVRPA